MSMQPSSSKETVFYRKWKNSLSYWRLNYLQYYLSNDCRFIFFI